MLKCSYQITRNIIFVTLAQTFSIKSQYAITVAQFLKVKVDNNILYDHRVKRIKAINKVEIFGEKTGSARNKYLKLESAIFHQVFIFSPSDSP